MAKTIDSFYIDKIIKQPLCDWMGTQVEIVGIYWMDVRRIHLSYFTTSLKSILKYECM